MGCGDALTFIGDPLGSSFGLQGPGTLVTHPWDIGSAVANDWSLIKHMLVPDMRRDREALVNGATDPRNIIYGKVRVSGQLAYAETGGTKNEYLHMVVIHAGHPIDSFEEVFLDDRLISEFGTNASIQQFDGTQTTACASLVAVSAAQTRTYTVTGNTVTGMARIGGIDDVKGLTTGMTVTGAGIPGGTTVTGVGDTYVDLSAEATADGTAVSFTITGLSPIWGSVHKLLGCAYSYVKLTYSDTLFPSGLPVPRVVIKGRKVYDPRTGLTQWSDNAALCVADYMTMGIEYGGMGCTVDEVDWQSVSDAANICDELVAANIAGTRTEKRYTCNGTVKVDGTPNQILTQMLTAMAGHAVYSQGKWKIYAGAYYPIALNGSGGQITIDETWLSGGIQYSLGTSKNDRVNTVKGQFCDPTDLWSSKDFPVIQSAAYLAEDGEELTSDVSLNFTTSITTAQRIGRILMERSRRGRKLTMPCNYKAFEIAPHEIVLVNNEYLGLVNAPYRVVGWSFSAAGGIQVQLAEEDSAIYGWVPEFAVVPTPPKPPDLPRPWNIIPPSNLAVSETPIVIPGQVTRSKVTLTWQGNDATAPNYVVQLDGIDYAGSITDTSFVFNNMLPGDYIFGVIAVNANNGRSAAATLSHTVTTSSLEVPSTSGLVPYTGATGNVDLGTHQIKAGTGRVGGATHYAQFESDGTLVLNGDATGWDDIDFPLIPKTTGAGAPSYQTVVGNLQALAFAVNDALLLEAVEQKHKIKAASTATWHVHMISMSNDGTDRGVKIELEYSSANVLPAGGVTAFPASTTVSAEITIPAGTPIHTHLILDISTFTTLLPAAHTMCRVKRIAATGTAPSADPCIIKVQYHAENDTPAGSRQITTK